MSTGSTTRHRSYQFSLGTMFVVVTVFAVWLGWELTYIRERRDFLATMYRNLEVDGATEVFIYEILIEPKSPKGSIPFWRRWLGDPAREQIYLWSDSADADRQKAAELFPEAQIGRRYKQVIRYPS